jgi:KDO2-lipid IV(A) lauroyltransferase
MPPPSLEARPTFGDRLQAAGTALFFGLFHILPLDVASALGGGLARAIGPRLGVSKRARRNLKAAFPALSPAEIEQIVRAMWDNLGRVMAEYPHLARLRVFPPGGRVELRGVEHVDAILAAGRRMIMVGGHLGNWEIGPLAAAQYGLSAALIYRALNNPVVDAMLARIRGESGELLPKGAIASRGAIAALREGKHLLLLVDQKFNDGIPVRFFGRDAMTAPALARLAQRYDCDVLPVRTERLNGARFRLTVYPKLDISGDATEIMARVNAELENWIRDRPEQWLWLHNRWPEDPLRPVGGEGGTREAGG